jgi:hypothetical protein
MTINTTSIVRLLDIEDDIVACVLAAEHEFGNNESAQKFTENLEIIRESFALLRALYTSGEVTTFTGKLGKPFVL